MHMAAIKQPPKMEICIHSHERYIGFHSNVNELRTDSFHNKVLDINSMKPSRPKSKCFLPSM
ncbi:hypothetical protein MTBBW1_60024 [Desulfamplus magnetovallimortis]|uniref:Uncharacterized protein n=1 Tax=Desulfamplus magnetovallimortis TaxID=1246637 RepID=A0A1W1HI24_9BACT|nr:hypothetical protein MTBBW1_60024 [Desulfamplus magnetovallimortis]